MNALGIFVKHPIPGTVKTRLGAEIGEDRAAELYAAFVTDLAERFRGIGDRRFLCHAPNESSAVDYFTTIAQSEYELWPQPATSLGERLSAFFASAFSEGAERVVVIGSDSPTLPGNFVEDAFSQLRDHDCVLGPATDGGYYLVGQRSPGAPIFDQIEWSGPEVLQQTVERVAAAQRSKLALLTPWYDVDTLNDLKLLKGHIRALQHAEIPLRLDATGVVLFDCGTGIFQDLTQSRKER